MYKVYVLRRSRTGSRIVQESRAKTASLAVAEEVWADLVAADYDSRHILLMTLDGRRIRSHIYGSGDGGESE